MGHCAIIIDGTPFKGRQMIAAIGMGNDGKKTVLGLREGATENATVVSCWRIWLGADWIS
jgi:transposase-like protein